MALTRVQKNLVTALVLLGGGGGAALYTLKTKVKTPDERFKEAQDQKRLFHFGRDHVASGRIAAPTSTLAFTRDEVFGWVLTEPVRWPADVQAIEAALDRMAGLIMDPIVTDDAGPEDLRRAGLERPRITMQVDLQAGGEKVLFVGALNKMVGRYPVTDVAKKRVGLSDKEFYWALDRKLDEFRDPRVFPVPTMKVRRVLVTAHDARRVGLVSDGNAWTAEGEGLTEAIRADDGLVGGVLVALTKEAKAERYLTDAYAPADAATYGLDGEDALTIEVELEGGARRKARLGRFTEADASAATEVAWVEGTTTVLALPAGILEKVRHGAADYRDRTLSRFAPSAVTKVRLEISQQPAIELNRNGDAWQMSAPQAAAARAWKADALVRAFSGLRVNSWKTDASTKAQRLEWLLEPWNRRAIFYGEDGGVLADVRVGNMVDDDHVFVQAAEATRVGIISAAKVQVFPATPAELIDDGT